MQTTVRAATLTDLEAIEHLDAVSFGKDNAETEQAAPGELERGVREGLMLVACTPAAVIGFVQVHAEPAADTFFVAGLAVDPAYRRAGVAGRLLAAVVEHARASSRTAVVSMSVAPANLPMLRVATRAGFSGTDYVDGYYGPGRDRLVVALRPGLPAPDGEPVLVPAPNDAALRERLASADWVLAGIRELPHGTAYELRRASASDRASMMANEASVSVGFSSVMIAALAFLTGFGLANDRFPADLLSQLALALVACVISLIIYANSTAELSASNFADFSDYMETGNIVSEFGGAYPILHVLPVAVLVISGHRGAGIATCIGASVAALLYQLSPFDILDRFDNSRPLFAAITAYLVLSPVLGVVCWLTLDTTAPWSAANVLVLFATGLVCERRVHVVDARNRPDRLGPGRTST